MADKVANITLSKDKDESAFWKKTKYFALSKEADGDQQPIIRRALIYPLFFQVYIRLSIFHIKVIEKFTLEKYSWILSLCKHYAIY